MCVWVWVCTHAAKLFHPIEAFAIIQHIYSNVRLSVAMFAMCVCMCVCVRACVCVCVCDLYF